MSQDKITFVCPCGATITYHGEYALIGNSITTDKIHKWHLDHKKCLEIRMDILKRGLSYATMSSDN